MFIEEYVLLSSNVCSFVFDDRTTTEDKQGPSTHVSTLRSLLVHNLNPVMFFVSSLLLTSWRRIEFFCCFDFSISFLHFLCVCPYREHDAVRGQSRGQRGPEHLVARNPSSRRAVCTHVGPFIRRVRVFSHSISQPWRLPRSACE